MDEKEKEQKSATVRFDALVDQLGLALLETERQMLWQFFVAGVGYGMDRVKTVIRESQKGQKPSEWTKYDEMS